MAAKPISLIRTPPSGPIPTFQSNCFTVLDVIRQFGPISRAELARKTAFSAPAISTYVGYLLDKNLVAEVGLGVSNGGRRPILMQFNAKYGYVMATDLTVGEIRYALADLQGHIIATSASPASPYQYPTITIGQITDAVRALLQDAGVPDGSLLCMTIVIPGIVDTETGVVLMARHLMGWQNIPLQAILQKEFGIPVHVGNDLNMAAWGEHWRGATMGVDNSVLIGLCAGIGAGIIINGQLYLGHHMLAGELGSMVVGVQSLKGNYGDRGCLDSLTGSAAMAQRVTDAIRRGPQTVLTDLYAAEDFRVTPAHIFQAALEGDQLANEIVDDLVAYLALAVTNIMTFLDPAVIVFAGDLVAGGDQLLERVKRLALCPIPAEIQITFSQLGDDAQVFGALATSLEMADEQLLMGLEAR